MELIDAIEQNSGPLYAVEKSAEGPYMTHLDNLTQKAGYLFHRRSVIDLHGSICEDCILALFYSNSVVFTVNNLFWAFCEDEPMAGLWVILLTEKLAVEMFSKQANLQSASVSPELPYFLYNRA